MPQSKLVFVTGATGKQGGAVVEALLTRGHQVRALIRNPASPAANRLREQGVEIAVGDFADHDSLVRAARGADAVYAMSTPYEQGAEKETAQGITITDAAKAAGVAHFIYSSVASANHATGLRHFDGKYAVEKHIQASGVLYTIVAPVFFMENLLQPWMLLSLRQGKLAMALPASRSLQQITVADIGAFVAAAIERRDTVFGRRFDIAGDELTGEEAAAILSQATGREVHYEGFPPEVLRAQSEDMALMFEWFDRTGYTADIKSLRRDFPEVKWHTFEQWARQQDWRVLDQGLSSSSRPQSQRALDPERRQAMPYNISTLLTRNLHDVFGENDPVRRRAAIDEIFTEDCVFYDPRKGAHRGRDEIDRIAGVIRATHPDFRYQPIAAPEELGNSGRIQWVSGRPGEAPAYAGTDFIVARDGRIAALYLFFDKLP